MTICQCYPFQHQSILLIIPIYFFYGDTCIIYLVCHLTGPFPLVGTSIRKLLIHQNRSHLKIYELFLRILLRRKNRGCHETQLLGVLFETNISHCWSIEQFFWPLPREFIVRYVMAIVSCYLACTRLLM